MDDLTMTEQDEQELWEAICRLHPVLKRNHYITHGLIIAGLAGLWAGQFCPDHQEERLEWLFDSIRKWIETVGHDG